MADKRLFTCSSIDPEIMKYEGEVCEIVRHLTGAEADAEVGPMYEVRFADGHMLHVFEDEITEKADA